MTVLGHDDESELRRRLAAFADPMALLQGLFEHSPVPYERQHGTSTQEVAAPDWTRAYGLRTLAGAPLPLERTPLYRALHLLVRRCG